MTRTVAEIRAAYESWRSGRSWTEIAQAHGYTTAEEALSSVRRYADANQLPFTRTPPMPQRVRLRKSYCAFLLGSSWETIATEYGWANGPAAQSAVEGYAAAFDLPLARLP